MRCPRGWQRAAAGGAAVLLAIGLLALSRLPHTHTAGSPSTPATGSERAWPWKWRWAALCSANGAALSCGAWAAAVEAEWGRLRQLRRAVRAQGMVAVDESKGRYYASRDLASWQEALLGQGVRVSEASVRALVHRNASAMACMAMQLAERVCVPRFPEAEWITQVPGLRGIVWRKDALCRTLKRFEGRTGLATAAFTFPCWVIPEDGAALQAAMRDGAAGRRWVLKPAARGEGRGISLVATPGDLGRASRGVARGAPLVVQPLLDPPLLIDGFKWDLRCYVLVTSAAPLRLYVYREGLVRFASQRYQGGGGVDQSQREWMTNTFLNKQFQDITNLTWTFARLRRHMAGARQDPDAVFRAIRDSIASIFLAAEQDFAKAPQCRFCYQLLGVDVILDTAWRPRVIEINGMPSMQLTKDQTGLSGGAGAGAPSAYDETKTGLVREVARVVYADGPAAPFGTPRPGGVLQAALDACRRGDGGACQSPHALPFFVDWARELQLVDGLHPVFPSHSPSAALVDLARSNDCREAGEAAGRCRLSNAQVLEVLGVG